MKHRLFLSLLSIAALRAPALAGDGGPVRCEAVWRGPATGCDLSGDWATTGLGRDERHASRAATERLQEAVSAGADSAALRLLGDSATAVQGGQAESCAEIAATRARLTCFAEPTLKEERLCYADLPVPGCWQGGPFSLEGVAWRSMERGRDQVCDKMEAQLLERGASLAERTACAASCQQQARVRCPPTTQPR